LEIPHRKASDVDQKREVVRTVSFAVIATVKFTVDRASPKMVSFRETRPALGFFSHQPTVVMGGLDTFYKGAKFKNLAL
jgi:hypothetical protein